MKIVTSFSFSEGLEAFRSLMDGLPKHLRMLLDQHRSFDRDARTWEMKEEKYGLAFSLKGRRVEFSICLDEKKRNITVRLVTDDKEMVKLFIKEFGSSPGALMPVWFISHFNSSPKPKTESTVLVEAQASA